MILERLGKSRPPALTQSGMLKQQDNKCAGCAEALRTGLFASKPRICEYSFALYCRSCHSGQRRIIPARALWAWDLQPAPVSDKVAKFLDAVEDKPLICIAAVNPDLYDLVTPLHTARLMRVQLCLMREFLQDCKRRAALLAQLEPRSYYVDNFEMWSLSDLTRVASGSLATYLSDHVQTIGRHITTECRGCQSRALTCGFCRSPAPVYSFDIRNVVQCDNGCGGFYHRNCFIPEACPRCLLGSESGGGFYGSANTSLSEFSPLSDSRLHDTSLVPGLPGLGDADGTDADDTAPAAGGSDDSTPPQQVLGELYGEVGVGVLGVHAVEEDRGPRRRFSIPPSSGGRGARRAAGGGGNGVEHHAVDDNDGDDDVFQFSESDGSVVDLMPLQSIPEIPSPPRRKSMSRVLDSRTSPLGASPTQAQRGAVPVRGSLNGGRRRW